MPMLVLHVMIFQSTLPRGSDTLVFGAGSEIAISIHAPSRERRVYFGHIKHTHQISIHAPSRERPSINADTATPTSISIHAPSRERRADPVSLLTVDLYFNPRSLAGATLFFSLTALTFGNFNPRSLAGATRAFYSQVALYGNFNPRSLAGAT